LAPAWITSAPNKPVPKTGIVNKPVVNTNFLVSLDKGIGFAIPGFSNILSNPGVKSPLGISCFSFVKPEYINCETNCLFIPTSSLKGIDSIAFKDGFIPRPGIGPLAPKPISISTYSENILELLPIPLTIFPATSTVSLGAFLTPGWNLTLVFINCVELLNWGEVEMSFNSLLAFQLSRSFPVLSW